MNVFLRFWSTKSPETDSLTFEEVRDAFCLHERCLTGVTQKRITNSKPLWSNRFSSYLVRSSPMTSDSSNAGAAPSSHHNKCSKTPGAQAMRKPPSQQNPNSSSDLANKSRKTLFERYDVGMTNLLRSFPTYTARQPAGTSGGGLEHSTSLS